LGWGQRGVVLQLLRLLLDHEKIINIFEVFALTWLVLMLIEVGMLVKVDGGFVVIHSFFKDKSSFDGVVPMV
jgi:hypothetical protein